MLNLSPTSSNRLQEKYQELIEPVIFQPLDNLSGSKVFLFFINMTCPFSIWSLGFCNTFYLQYIGHCQLLATNTET